LIDIDLLLEKGRIDNMCLTDAPAHVKLKVVEIQSGTDAKRKLNFLGIHINDSLIKLSRTSWGPVLVQGVSNGINKLAVGRGLAKNIIVEYEL
jgi:Fe2+ transport system protein FeoA